MLENEYSLECTCLLSKSMVPSSGKFGEYGQVTEAFISETGGWWGASKIVS